MSKLLPRWTSSAAIVVVASLVASSLLSGQTTSEAQSLAGTLAAKSVNDGAPPAPSDGLTLNQRLMWDVLSLFEDSVAAEGAWERGIDYVGRVLEDDPTDEWTHRTLAINFLDHGDYRLAHQHFESYPVEYDLGDWSGYRWQAATLANLSDRWVLVSRRGFDSAFFSRSRCKLSAYNSGKVARWSFVLPSRRAVSLRAYPNSSRW